jgi:hypothetical protein
MNETDIQARVLFASNCVKGANAFAAGGEHSLAAELRETAQRYVAEANAAVAHLRAVTPAQQRARAFASVVLAGFGRVH